MTVYQVSDNRIDADDQKLNELMADGILNEIPCPVYWIDRGALQHTGMLKDFHTTSVDELIVQGILALLNPKKSSDG